MNEKQTKTTKTTKAVKTAKLAVAPAPLPHPVAEATVRPTKKQRELLTYIDTFIKEHGYSPSYREIMSGLNYSSVATVALHVGNLIKRGHVRKRDRSARSLEVVSPSDAVAGPVSIQTNQVAPNEEKWLVEKVEYLFKQQENQAEITQPALDELYVLVGALRVLGVEGAAQSLLPRLQALKAKVSQAPPSPNTPA